MKKHIALLVLFICVFAIDAKSQSIKDDSDYLKQFNYFWGITNSFSKVRLEYEKQSDKVLLVRAEQVKIIVRLLEKSKSGFEKLRTAYSGEKEFKDVEEVRQVLQNSLAGLQSEKWRSEPTWQLTYYLVQLKLEDKLEE